MSSVAAEAECSNAVLLSSSFIVDVWTASSEVSSCRHAVKVQESIPFCNCGSLFLTVVSILHRLPACEVWFSKSERPGQRSVKTYSVENMMSLKFSNSSVY